MYAHIDNNTAINMLMERLEAWTDDKDTQELFEQYYTEMIEGGCFDGGEFDPMYIVDNDYINWFSVMDDEELKEAFPDDEDATERIYATANGFHLVYMA